MELKGSFAAFLRYQARTSKGFMRKTADGSLKGMQHSIVEATPRRSGRLQRSMKKTKVTRRADGVEGFEGEVYSKLKYAWVVNQGRTHREVHASPGSYFIIGGHKVTHYTQSAFAGRHMFERGAFDWSVKHAEPYMVLQYEEWNREALAHTGQRG